MGALGEPLYLDVLSVLKDTDVEAHIKLITRKSMSGSMVTRYSLVFTKPEEDDKREGKK